MLTIRVSDRDLRGFDAALSRWGIAHRSDAMRRLMLAADDLLRPDEVMTEELRAMSAALNRVGNNVNQVARRLNKAKLKGERLPHTAASDAENRGLAGASSSTWPTRCRSSSARGAARSTSR